MKNLKISKESIIFFLLIFFSLKIGCLSYFSSALNILWFLGSILAILYSILYLLKKNKFNLFDLLVLLFYVVLFISTVVNHGAVYDCIKDILSFFSLYLSMKIGLERNPKKYIKFMNAFLLVFTLINTLTTIIYYPNAMFLDNRNPIFFLGGDNTAVRLYIASVLFYVLNNYIKKQKLKLPIIPLINLLSFSFIRDLGGGKACFLILLFSTIYLVYGVKIPKKIIKLTIIFNVILFLLLIVINKIDIFSYLIVNILNRNLTLTDRTIIWEITIDMIKARPIFGYGMIDGMAFQALLPYILGVNAHNTYLMILFNGGIILFVIFILLFVMSSKKFDRVRHKRWMYIIPFALLTLMIRAQIEGWDVIWIILFLLMSYYYEKIENIIISPSKNNIQL